jgi:glycosyltransferase involved in cell wall biosynthesis
VAPWYREAQVAAVPLRAGGGTRIKILEAFAHGRPVVSTTIGIEGIAAEPGRHALIADDAVAFAAACLRLLRDPALAEAMTREAFSLFSRGYSDQTLATAIAALAPGSPP